MHTIVKRLDDALKFKDEGNKLFKANNPSEAKVYENFKYRVSHGRITNLKRTKELPTQDFDIMYAFIRPQTGYGIINSGLWYNLFRFCTFHSHFKFVILA